MPRKCQSKKSRRLPEIPDGNEGQDLTKSERQKKLEVFLADFDRKFNEKKEMIQDEIAATMKQIDTFCRMGVQQIPKSLRKMTLADFIAAGGTFESALQYLDQKENNLLSDENVVESLKALGQGNGPSDKMLYSDPTFKKIVAECASEMEEQFESENQYTKSSRKASQKCPLTITKPFIHSQDLINNDIDSLVTQTLHSTHNRKIVKSAMKAPLSTVRKSSRLRTVNSKMIQTPMVNPMLTRDFRTPAITPKFDPKLPMTPFDRSPKPGERFMSIAGSPIVVQRRKHKNLDKIQEKISSALVSEAFDTGAINILNEVLDMLKE